MLIGVSLRGKAVVESYTNHSMEIVGGLCGVWSDWDTGAWTVCCPLETRGSPLREDIRIAVTKSHSNKHVEQTIDGLKPSEVKKRG